MIKNKLLLPGVTMLSGLILWLIFFFWNEEISGLSGWSFGFNIIFCFVIAGLFVYSAISCQRATGGRKGNTVRTVLLLILATVTFFKIDIYTSLILALAAIITGVMAFKGTDFAEDKKKSILKSWQENNIS